MYETNLECIKTEKVCYFRDITHFMKLEFVHPELVSDQCFDTFDDIVNSK